MADRILFNPDNRQLGNSTGDFSLYGGQSERAEGLRAPDLSSSMSDSPAPPGGSDPGAALISTTPGGPSEALPSATDTMLYGSGAAAPSSFVSALAPAALLGPAVPHADAGSGAPIPVSWSGPQPIRAPIETLPQTPALEITPDAAAAAAPAPSAPMPVDAAPASLVPGSSLSSGVEAVTAPVTALVGGLLAPVPTLAEPVLPVVDAALDTVNATLAQLTDATGAVLDTAGIALETLVTTPGALVGETVDTVAETAGTLVEATGETVADTTATLASAVPAIAESAGETVGGLVETTGSTVTAVVGGVTDTLSDLAGSDPEAGVATLVSLVSTADALDLQPLDAPLLDTVVDTGLDLVDTLAAEDGLVGSLLGGGDHDGGLFGHDSDHSLGLL